MVPKHPPRGLCVQLDVHFLKFDYGVFWGRKHRNWWLKATGCYNSPWSLERWRSGHGWEGGWRAAGGIQPTASLGTAPCRCSHASSEPSCNSSQSICWLPVLVSVCPVWHGGAHKLPRKVIFPTKCLSFFSLMRQPLQFCHHNVLLWLIFTGLCMTRSCHLQHG